jgi:hypothetical protein
LGTIRWMHDHKLPIALRRSEDPRWLTLMDQYSHPIRAQRLEPGADLAATYESAKAALVADGYTLESESGFGFCFAVRGAEKVQLVMRVVPPDEHLTGHGGSIGVGPQRSART